MELKDFYSAPAVFPVSYSADFLEKNRREVLAFQKDFKENYKAFFRPKRFFYLMQCHLRKEFVIGQASFSGLGDTVLYSHLPHLIKSQWPRCRVFVYETVFSKAVFANNPFIDGFTTDKKHLWKKKGSGSDYGSGHFTQRKARFFGLKECLPKGEIFISDQERHWVASRLPKGKPMATFHAHGKSNQCSMPDEVWAAVVQEMQKTHYVIQLKSPQENAIKGVDEAVSGIRECIVYQSAADIHVGVDSGFAHTAAALGIPAVIILEKVEGKLPLLVNGVHQLVLPQVRGERINFLYPQYSYLCVGPSTPKAPPLTQQTLRMAMEGLVYPFRKREVWDICSKE